MRGVVNLFDMLKTV